MACLTSSSSEKDSGLFMGDGILCVLFVFHVLMYLTPNLPILRIDVCTFYVPYTSYFLRYTEYFVYLSIPPRGGYSLYQRKHIYLLGNEFFQLRIQKSPAVCWGFRGHRDSGTTALWLFSKCVLCSLVCKLNARLTGLNFYSTVR